MLAASSAENVKQRSSVCLYSSDYRYAAVQEELTSSLAVLRRGAARVRFGPSVRGPIHLYRFQSIGRLVTGWETDYGFYTLHP